MKNTSHYIIPFFETLIFSILAFLAPIKGLLLLTGGIVLLDTVYAIYATVKLNGWSSFESNKLFNIVVKTFFYLGSIIIAYMTDIHIIGDNTLFGIDLIASKVLTLFWIYIEAKSVDETSVKLGNKPFYRTIKGIIARLKSLKVDVNELKG